MAATHFSGLSIGVTNITANATVTERDHAGRTLVLDNAAGATVTLPAATGTGNVYRFFIKTTVTSNNYIIQVANATDILSGVAVVANDTDASASLFETGASDDTATMNGTTTGGLAGTMITVIDVASGVFAYHSTGAATGVEATPFSAAV